jgi:tRNA threonylcarbamoyl adenosine modification protein (Sua5/YciO/YrdC/YwlC family)
MSSVEQAARAALGGALVVLPTDTVYGIGTRPDDPAATGRLFEAKARPRHLELPVLVPSIELAEQVGDLDEAALRLAEAFWPGALTLVVPRAVAAEAWELGEDPGTVGLRIPAHPVALELLEHTGPLAVTSANRSGEPTPTTCDGVRAVFGDDVGVYLCAEEPLTGASSTVVDLARGEPRVLRWGSVDADALRAVLADVGFPTFD